MLNNFSGSSVGNRREARQKKKKVGRPVMKLFLVYERDGQDSSSGVGKRVVDFRNMRSKLQDLVTHQM